MINGASGENPHATGEHRIGVSFHHKHLQIRTVIDQHDGGGRSYGNVFRDKICHFEVSLPFSPREKGKLASKSGDVHGGVHLNFKKYLLAGALVASFGISAEEIVLQDGSRIKGKILSMNGGSYQLQTDSMGVITIDKSKIISISQGGSLPTIANDAAMETGQSAVQSLQTNMAADQGLMTSILHLQSDPDMQAVLSDPELMRAVQSFDLQTLKNHPKIKKLMANSRVQSIQKKVSP